MLNAIFDELHSTSAFCSDPVSSLFVNVRIVVFEWLIVKSWDKDAWCWRRTELAAFVLVLVHIYFHDLSLSTTTSIRCLVHVVGWCESLGNEQCIYYITSASAGTMNNEADAMWSITKKGKKSNWKCRATARNFRCWKLHCSQMNEEWCSCRRNPVMSKYKEPLNYY